MKPPPSKHGSGWIAVCVAVFLGGVVAAAVGWQRYAEYPEAPLDVRLEDAPKHMDGNPWVTITDASWQCDHPIHPLRSDSRQIALWRTNANVVVIADFEGNMRCADLTARHARGTLDVLPRSSPYFQDLVAKGLRVAPGVTVLFLCAYCGPRNELALVLFGIPLALISLGVAVHLARRSGR